ETLRRGDWGVSLGTIWTPLDAPEWAVVDGPSGERVLRQIDEDNRSGLPVLMVEFSPPEDRLPFRGPVRPWLELGTSLDWDRPAFLIGGAARLGPFFRIGVGYTMQIVEMPEGGLAEGAILGEGDVLALRDEWEGDIYVSFSIGLGELHRWKK
ncbi:MAG: hypothetical protein R3338_09210, partial [Thermoanaerobaculia bacterium]|nr:hypothetical protein [Thermoanaerobaculia bacterium]